MSRPLIALILITMACSPALAQQPSQVSVTDYGAKGDGVTDDTAAFQTALNAVADRGGTVSVPVGNYLIKTHLSIPSKVALEGIWKVPTAFTQMTGSTLIAVEGEGSEDGPAFITLHANSTIKGITVYYPNQKPEAISKYPWCIQGAGGDNMSIVDCLLVNPYMAVDFGTNASGRHYIRNLYGQPLRKGIFIDKCFDVGRIENVHFWPFWKWGDNTSIQHWMTANGEAFIFGRTDWEYVLNTFSFGYGIGHRFIQTKDGSCNGNFVGIGADATNIAVLVEQCQPPGLLITNGEFVSFFGSRATEVVVKKTNSGVVQFTNCSFWGPASQIARIDGTGTTSFNNCNFCSWDVEKMGASAIETFGGNLLVNGCNFMMNGPQVMLRPGTQSAVVTANRMAGPIAVSNPGKANLQIGLNAFQKPPQMPREEKRAIVVDDTDRAGVSYAGQWYLAENSTAPGIGYFKGVRWAAKGTGNAKATFTPTIPKSGRYTVYAWFGPDPGHDHASNAPVTIASAEGTKTIRIDLRDKQGQWIKLGAYRFAAGRKGSITFTNNADGNVLADAVKLTPSN